MNVSTQNVKPDNDQHKDEKPVEAALKLAALGFRVFRLRPNSKAAFKGWQSEASDNATKIKALWGMTPEAGVGLAMGNGLVAIDLDKKPNRDGLQSICDYLKVSEFELSEMTRVHVTPSGGRHLIFTCDDDFGNSVGLLNGVDVRGEGGYIAGPGTVIDGAAYSVESDIRPHLLPANLSTLLKQSRERDSQAQVEMFELDLPESISRAIEFLQRRPSAIEGQGGNEHTYVTALEVRDLCISEEKCRELMLEHWNERCDPPWSADEIEVPIRNAYRYAKDRPGNKGGIAAQYDDSELYDKDNKDSGEPKPRFIVQSESMQDATSDIEYLMERIVPVESIGLIYAAEMSFKTFMALDMVLCGAAGIPWAKGDGHSGFAPIRPLNVIFIAGEGARGIAKKRRPAWRQHHGIEGTLPFYTIGEMPRFTSAEDVKALTASISESPCPKPDIIVIDTVAVALTGADESKTMDTAILIANCRKLIREFGCSVILIHHTGKDEKKGPRGATNLPYSSDFRYRVRPVAGSTPEQPIVTIKQEKMKDEDKLPPMRFVGRKMAESLVFERVSSVKIKGGVLTDTIDIVTETLETIPQGIALSASKVARYAVSGNFTQDSEGAMKKRILRDMEKDDIKPLYGKLIRENDKGEIVFIGQQEPDEETGETDAPDI